MTLTQLRYVAEVAKTKSINATAHALYISQPSLSAHIKDLEQELGIVIFNRTNRGITLTKDGETFIRYVNNILQQYHIMEQKYLKNEKLKDYFSVTMHHSTFSSKIFTKLMNEFGFEDYEYSVFETKTGEVINHVSSAKSDLGILYISSFNQDYYERIFKEKGLEYVVMGEFPVYAYVREQHPLARQDTVELSDLENYPCLIFDQDENSSYYFYEEIISTYEYKNIIRTSDRATTMELLRGLDAYSVGTGTINDQKTIDGITALKVNTDEIIHVVYLRRKDSCLSQIATRFVEIFTEFVKNKNLS